MARKKAARKAPHDERPLPTLFDLRLEAERLAAVLMMLEEAHGGIRKNSLYHALDERGLLLAPFCELMPLAINKSLQLAADLGRHHIKMPQKVVA